ncbi:hypothetical protein BOTBODRAFT_45332 [Botryobasidium botryosum FD-172 SS1]|uniref:Uncharacterized protein n=1 Tax=Botryobasidium botryosum (strain FD-172 SS1) TaxID=930990 RepID=A0A067MNF6_BOTB1|nr:hypothetical protein BOTBODRAFT_45332 [Botryobasidium botryosum FD-172 SS1]
MPKEQPIRLNRAAKCTQEATSALAASMRPVASSLGGGDVLSQGYHNYLFAGESTESLHPPKVSESEHTASQPSRSQLELLAPREKDLLKKVMEHALCAHPMPDKVVHACVKKLLKLGETHAVQQQYLNIFLAHIENPGVVGAQLQE